MKAFLGVLSVLFLILSAIMYLVAKSAVHEIEAQLFLLMSVVCLSAVAILHRLASPSSLSNASRSSSVEVGIRSEIKGLCPACGLQNVPSATRCDCGYRLSPE